MGTVTGFPHTWDGWEQLSERVAPDAAVLVFRPKLGIPFGVREGNRKGGKRKKKGAKDKMLAPEEQEEEEEKCWLQKKKKKKKKKKNGGGGDADDDDGGDFSQFYIYKLPIDRLSGCYW